MLKQMQVQRREREKKSLGILFFLIKKLTDKISAINGYVQHNYTKFYSLCLRWTSLLNEKFEINAFLGENER